MDDTTRGVAEGSAYGKREPGNDGASRRTRELRAEIDQAREEMSETIDAIQDRLRPGNVVARAKDRVRNATSERMLQMAREGNRNNLAPAALIGIGTAWLMMNRGASSRREWSSGPARTRGAYGFGEFAGETTIGTGGTAGTVEVDVEGRDRTGVAAMAGRTTERAGEWAEETRQAVQRTSRRAQNQFSRMLDENPLAVGAAAFAIGAIVGMALPESERENRLMGEARETVVDRAKESAREAASRVKEAASDAAMSSITGGEGGQES